MKKIILNIVLALALVLLIVGLYFCGFRIVYDPTIITNWDAVSGCAAWVGVVTSVVAIWYAIQVPKKIADRQDKIALFDKRLEFYNCLIKCDVFGKAISNLEDIQEIQAYFFMAFGEEVICETGPDFFNKIIIKLYTVQNTLKKGVFLFDFETEKWVQPLRNALNDIIALEPKDCSSVVIASRKKFYKEAVFALENNLIDQIRDSLKMQR